MTPQEAFKVGFLIRCAEEGLTPQQTEERIEKTAAAIKQGKIGDWMPSPSTFTDPLKWIANKALLAGIVAPPAVGAAGGWALANAQDDEYNVDEAKKEEELAAYYRAIDQLSRSRRMRAAA